ncbi:MAG: hypothetical protein H0V17_14950 [Deltaproteobacteria bacterium]|nr:hypothetical protein [Deltaproteobacteria bacterium]
MRCRECHATLSTPTAREALTIKCTYCGLEQPAPDAEQRREALFEEQREARLRAEAEQRAKEHASNQEAALLEREAKTKEASSARRGRWMVGLFTLLSALVAPVIIAITVFDAPARLGFGASGKDRLEQIQTQLASVGCKIVHPIDSEYTSSAVSKLVGVGEGECIRAFAAGGDGHRRLAIKLFGPTGTELAHQAETADPQLQYCSATAQTLRFQIDVGAAAKGRLSHMVLQCPAPPPPKPRPRGKPHAH